VSGEDYIMRGLMICTPHHEIEKNEMGGACSMYGGVERWGNLRERDHLKDPGVDGRII